MEANVFISVINDWKLTTHHGYELIVPDGQCLEIAIGVGDRKLIVTPDGSRVTYRDTGLYQDHADYHLFVPWSEIKELKLFKSTT